MMIVFAFVLQPVCCCVQERVEQGIESEGSNLSGVSSRCSWEEPGDFDLHSNYNDDDKENRMSDYEHSRNSDYDRRHISDYGRSECLLQYSVSQAFCKVQIQQDAWNSIRIIAVSYCWASEVHVLQCSFWGELTLGRQKLFLHDTWFDSCGDKEKNPSPLNCKL